MSHQAKTRSFPNDPGQLLLSKDQLSAIAKDKGFIMRRSAKFSAYAFIYAFFQTALQGRFTLQAWADKLQMFCTETFSRQALFQKLNENCVEFLKNVLGSALQLTLPSLNLKLDACLRQFNQVLLEDSTCIKLPEFMRDAYPGANNKKAKTAIAKVQTVCELFTHSFLKLDVTSYRKNDQSQAESILSIAQKGSLLLRDMGYFSLASLKKLYEAGIYFIGRLPFKVNMYDLQGNAIEFSDWIENVSRKEEWVLLGAEKKLKVRLIVIKLSNELASRKRQKARKDKHKSANHNEDYIFRQGYTIMVTSVEEQSLSMDQILDLYRLRWRIEIIFKSWKSCFSFADQFMEVKTKSRSRIEAMLYLQLLYVVMVQAPAYNYFARKIYEIRGELISWMAFSVFLLNNYISSTRRWSKQMIDKVAQSCRHHKKKDRISFPSLLALA